MASSAAYQIGQTWRESQDTNALAKLVAESLAALPDKEEEEEVAE